MRVNLRCLLLISLIPITHICAQSEGLFILPRLEGPIQFDGLPDEPAWEALEPLPLIMSQPNFGSDPTEKTEIRIAYNDDYLYAAGRFYDSDPGGIRGYTLERDGASLSDDGFALILDTYNDNESALSFVIIPSGARSDWAVFNDAEAAEGTLPFNSSWNTFWDAAVTRNEEGWFAEIRIPFSSLRFQDDEGRVVMGLITWRYIARKNEIVSYPSISPKWQNGIIKPSIAQDVVLYGVYSRNPVYITPYILGGTERYSDLNNAGSAYQQLHKTAGDVGLDLKFGITSNLTMDVTLNTDFAQVEADDPKINLTRFSLFFPEKRLFFQERSSVFNFSFGGPTQLFYSRRIGLYDIGDYDYRPVPIQGGVRLVGRIGTWDMGLLDMQTAGAEFSVTDDVADSTVGVPAENFGVLRLRRQVLNPYSYAGMMLTSRIGQDGRHNYGVGVDGNIRMVGDNYLVFSVAQTMDSETESSSLPDANRIRLSWENRSQEGFSYDLFFARRGPSYIPGMGFEVYEDYFVLARRLAYAWLPGEESHAFRHTMALEFYFLFQNAERTLESAELGPAWTYEGKNGSFARVWTKGRFESLHDTLHLPEDVFVPLKRYTFYELGGMYQMPQGKLLRLNFNITAGQFYDGLYVTTGLAPAWTVSRHLTLRASYQPTWARFSERDQAFMSHLIWFRMNAALNTQLIISAFVQYNSAVDAVGINIRFRYNPREGTDFYLVYNEGLNTDRHRGTPVLPVSDARTVLLKYSTTFLPW